MSGNAAGTVVNGGAGVGFYGDSGEVVGFGWMRVEYGNCFSLKRTCRVV